MDLIKQLGGYERAKRVEKNVYGTGSRLIRYPSEDFDYNDDGGNVCDVELISFKANDLKKSLLEYRREHNIFEVRDLVVGRCYEDYDDSILTITEKFDHFGNPSVVFECERTICDDFESELRHATNEEIAAGHRL